MQNERQRVRERGEGRELEREIEREVKENKKNMNVRNFNIRVKEVRNDGKKMTGRNIEEELF